MKNILIIFGILSIFGCCVAHRNGRSKSTCVQTKNCTGEYYFSFSRCDCRWFCDNYYCDSPRILTYDPIREDCFCPCPPRTECSGFNQRYSRTICGCRCNQTLTCPYPMIFNDAISSCDCECPAKTCPDNQVVLKSKNCECGCANEVSCPPNQYFDSSSCKCVCNPFECPFGKVQNYSDCTCECNEAPSCESFQDFNTDTCKCQCKVDDSENCNKKAPIYGWNSSSCNCKLCPDEAAMKERCDVLAGKYSWNSVLCNCDFCPRRNEEKLDCDAKGLPYEWSESNCECTFCLNREARRLNCGSDFNWDDEMCSCIPTTTTSTSTTEVTSGPGPITTPPYCIETSPSLDPPAAGESPVINDLTPEDTARASTDSLVMDSSTTTTTTKATTTTTTAASAAQLFNLAGPVDFGFIMKVCMEIFEEMFDEAFGGMDYQQIMTSLLQGLPGTTNNTI